MKIPVLFKTGLLACGLGLMAAPAAVASIEAPAPAALKVQVNVPTTWNLVPGEPLPDFLATSLSEALARQGLRKMPVTALRAVEDATKVPYLLKIDVTEWNRTIEGDLKCTFTATLRTPHGESRLGVYSDTRWAPGVIYAHSKSAYFPTRLEPIRALCEDVENSKLLEETAA